MFNIYDYPLRNSIIIYFILIAIVILSKPKLLKDSKMKCLFPIVVILVATVSYYLFAMLGWFVS